MIRTSFASIEDFNIFYRDIFSHPSLLTVDRDIFTLIQTKSKNILKTISSMPQGPERTFALQNLFLQENPHYTDEELASFIDLQTIQYNNSEYALRVYKIYPFNRRDLLDNFFAGFLPSYSQELVQYMISTMGVIKQIGTNTGSAFIFKDFVLDSQIILDDINKNCSIQIKTQNLLNNLGKIESIISAQNNDIEHLNAMIGTMYTSILNLQRELDHEKSQGVNGYNRTWH